MSTAIQAHELSKRYRRVSALAGPNGAGETTLLRILAGLASPASGRAPVIDGAPRQDAAFLAEIGFLAQEIPLYRRFTTQDHIQPRAIAPQPLE